MAAFSNLVYFESNADLDSEANRKWEFLSNDVVLVRPWSAGDPVTKDKIKTVPQQAYIEHIPRMF